ncbi:MAG: hypothetical protein IKM06_04575 [Clostridia bacterium]|nr:hypothetical protein [Clostridia bacterium]
MAENTRAKMPIAHRAKQFAPFQSLKGFEEAIMNKEKSCLLGDISSADTERSPFPFNDIRKNSVITLIYMNDGVPVSFTGTVIDVSEKENTLSFEERIFDIDDIQALIF